MTLVHTDESKDAIKMYEELWKRIKDFVRSINNNLDDYDEKFIKVRFNSDEHFSSEQNTRITQHNNKC